MRTQERAEGVLAEIAAEAGVDFVKDGQWANTGTYRFVPKGSFVPLVNVQYSWQDGISTFHVFGPGEEDKQRVGDAIRVRPHEVGERFIEPLRAAVMRKAAEVTVAEVADHLAPQYKGVMAIVAIDLPFFMEQHREGDEVSLDVAVAQTISKALWSADVTVGSATAWTSAMEFARDFEQGDVLHPGLYAPEDDI